jgi:ribonuclease HII
LHRCDELSLFEFDKKIYSDGFSFVAGVDEAGRGPLAGPVVAAAVVLGKNIEISGLNDSKQLSEKKRNALFEIIKKRALFYSTEVVDNEIIDKINILQSTFLAMFKCINNLQEKPDICLIDGNLKIPNLQFKQKTIVSGDAKSACIAAASILAKVTRDNLMKDFAKKYPQYLFEKHKGYGTKAHIEAVKKHGVCSIHRKTFSPIKGIIDENSAGNRI